MSKKYTIIITPEGAFKKEVPHGTMPKKFQSSDLKELKRAPSVFDGVTILFDDRPDEGSLNERAIAVKRYSDLSPIFGCAVLVKFAGVDMFGIDEDEAQRYLDLISY